jgi:hypothetical protein
MNDPELIRGERPALTSWEKGLRWLAGFLAAISVGFGIWYIVKGIDGPAESLTSRTPWPRMRCWRGSAC